MAVKQAIEKEEVLFTSKSKEWLTKTLGEDGFNYLERSLAKMGKDIFSQVGTEQEAKKALGKKPSDISEKTYNQVIALLTGQSEKMISALELNDRGQYFVPKGEGVKAFKISRVEQTKVAAEFSPASEQWITKNLGEAGLEQVRLFMETKSGEDVTQLKGVNDKTYEQAEQIANLLKKNKQGELFLNSDAIAAYRSVIGSETIAVAKADKTIPESNPVIPEFKGVTAKK